MRFRVHPRKQRISNHAWKPAFLAAFRESSILKDACAAAGIVRQTVFYARKTDPAFARAFQLACRAIQIREGASLGRRLREPRRIIQSWRGQSFTSIENAPDGLLMERLSLRNRETRKALAASASPRMLAVPAQTPFRQPPNPTC